MAIESIGSVLKKKGDEICSVAPNAAVYEAVALMAAKGVAAILVIAEGALVGIISARDYGREIVLKEKSSRDVQVQDIMTTSLVTVTPQMTVLEAMALMSRHHIRHLPVLEDGRPMGLSRWAIL
jgi:CBS domain-containing protein